MKSSNHTILRISTVALCFSLAASFPMRADTLGYWKFSEGDAGSVASSVQSDVNGTKLIGAASGHAGGAAPQYSSDVPGKTIVDGVGGKVINGKNTTSMSFTGGDKNIGGIISIKTEVGSEVLLQPKSFTMEAFVKTGANQIFGYWFGKDYADTGSSWSVETSWKDGLVKLRMDNLTDTFHQYQNSDVESQAAANSNSTWHHVAVTYDDPTKTLTFFEDYKPMGKVILPPEALLQYDGGNLNIGNGTTENQGYGYTGLIDEVRMSDKVLTTDQFLRVK